MKQQLDDKHSGIRIVFMGIMLAFSSPSIAYKNDIAYNALAVELGLNLPDGSSVNVSQTEADTDGIAGPPYRYFPDILQAQFAGKIIIDVSNAGTEPSAHATSVGGLFYGNNGMAPGIDTVDVFEVNGWLQADYLMAGTSLKPLLSNSRIGNHSWVGSTGNPAYDADILRRLDWVIDVDEFIQLVGTRNSTGVNANLLSAAYNVLAVGKTNGLHSTGSAAIDATYVAGRSKTEIVAPLTTTSSATPVTAASAALLIQVAHNNPGLSDASTTNRYGNTVYNAERSETIKAALLAGADRVTKNIDSPADITDYRVEAVNRTSNGLDSRYGAGQLNIYNSYHIIAAGEQGSLEDAVAGAGSIANRGFDYDDDFGGSGPSNNQASYYFSTSADPVVIKTSLAWNINIAGGNTFFDGSATFYDLDLAIYDVTGGQLLVVESASSIDNTENIWTTLPAGRDYLLRVVPKAGQSRFSWDYALAWQIDTDMDADRVADTRDNCPSVANFEQTDNDGNGTGDVCEPPSIDGFWSDNTTAGSAVFVFGSHFDPLATQVSINGIDVPLVQVVASDMLVFILPEGNVDGPISVTTSHGSAVSDVDFGQLFPGLTISGLWPNQVPVGDFVFVFGSGFDDAGTQVSVNGLAIPLLQVVTDNMLIFQVPAGMTSGPVQVSTTAGSATSSSVVTVSP